MRKAERNVATAPERKAVRTTLNPRPVNRLNRADPTIAPAGPMALTKDDPVPRTRVGNDSPMKNKSAA